MCFVVREQERIDDDYCHLRNKERKREKVVVVVVVTREREKEKKVEHHHLTRNVPLLSLLKIGQTTIFSHLYIYT